MSSVAISTNTSSQPETVREHNVPRVSVVMGVYNEALRVGCAIDSILEQSFADFELVIVDDGSPDQTPSILESYRLCDPRVRIVTQQNTGLTRALIHGCAEARGRYIARQDADDWSNPNRLEVQVRMLDDNPD